MYVLTKDTNNYPQTEHEVVKRGYVRIGEKVFTELC
jgi:hypothetical protein